MTDKIDLVIKIMAYEDGTMTDKDTVAFFGELVASGMAWTLQGTYGRMANQLIETGYINRKGEVLKEV